MSNAAFTDAFPDTKPTDDQLNKICLSELQEYTNLNKLWALTELGRRYLLHPPPQETATTCLRLFKKAAAQGDACGEFWVGCCYDMGKGTKKSHQIATQFYELAAAKGYEPALDILRKIKEMEMEVSVKQLTPPVTSNSPPKNTIGMSAWDDGAPLDAKQMALRKLKRSTKKKKSWALYELGRRYDQGSNGMAENNTQAEKWYAKAVKQDGHPGAMCDLGVLLLKESIAPTADTKALELAQSKAVSLFHTAALKGYEPRLLRLTLGLSTCCVAGKSVLPKGTLFDILSIAAAQQNVHTYLPLAHAYFNGLGTNASITKAREWAAKAVVACGEEIEDHRRHNNATEGIYSVDFEGYVEEGKRRENTLKVASELLNAIDAKIQHKKSNPTDVETESIVLAAADVTTDMANEATAISPFIASVTPTPKNDAKNKKKKRQLQSVYHRKNAMIDWQDLMTNQQTERKKKKKKPLCCRSCGIQHTKTERLKRCLFCCDRDAVHCSWKCKLEDWPTHQEFCIRVGTAIHNCDVPTFVENIMAQKKE